MLDDFIAINKEADENPDPWTKAACEKTKEIQKMNALKKAKKERTSADRNIC